MSVGSICKNCIFAKWENKIQIGCHRDIYSKYEQCLVSEAFDPESGKQYKVIDRLCYHCRSDAWKSKYNTDNLDELFDITRKECELKLDAIIIIDKGKTIGDVADTIKSLETSTIKPKNIVIVNCQAIRPSELLHFLNCGGSILSWQVEFIMDDTLDTLDLIMPKLKNIYFLSIQAGTIIPQNMLEKIDSAIYDDLRQIVMAEMEPNGLFCMRAMYKNVGGNAGGKTAAEKIKILGEEQNCQKTIMKL